MNTIEIKDFKGKTHTIDPNRVTMVTPVIDITTYEDYVRIDFDCCNSIFVTDTWSDVMKTINPEYLNNTEGVRVPYRNF